MNCRAFMRARGRCHPRRRSPRRIGSRSSRSRSGIDRRPCCGRRSAGLECVELEDVTAVVDRGRCRPHVLLGRRPPCRGRMAQGVAARPFVCSSNSWRATGGGKRKLSVRRCRKTTVCLRSSQGCCGRMPRPVPTAWPSASTLGPSPPPDAASRNPFSCCARGLGTLRSDRGRTQSSRPRRRPAHCRRYACGRAHRQMACGPHHPSAGGASSALSLSEPGRRG